MLKSSPPVFILALAFLTTVPAEAGEIYAQGAASDDFQLDPNIVFSPDFRIGAVIERDRMYMAERPGFLHKHLPFTFLSDGLPYSGGFYLFDTLDHAKDFSNWVANDFILDGVPILQRPYFINPTAHYYKVIGAHEFADIHTSQVVVRAERWQTPSFSVDAFLSTLWPAVRLLAESRGYTAVWLLYNEQERLASIVYFDDRVGPWDRTQPDWASLNALAGEPTMGPLFDLFGWPKLFDRTSFVMTTWFPYATGDRGEAAIWPNSPPLPEPYSGDGVCVPSRGETYQSSPADCLPMCGDAIPEAGETTANCPSDVRL